jgi:hypothetical protein
LFLPNARNPAAEKSPVRWRTANTNDWKNFFGKIAGHATIDLG